MHTLHLWVTMKDWTSLILRFTKSITKSVLLSTETSTPTERIISRKYNTQVKYGFESGWINFITKNLTSWVNPTLLSQALMIAILTKMVFIIGHARRNEFLTLHRRSSNCTSGLDAKRREAASILSLVASKWTPEFLRRACTHLGVRQKQNAKWIRAYVPSESRQMANRPEQNPCCSVVLMPYCHPS
jgi:hypothetical protein